MTLYKRILFRADGNEHIGLGHIIRSLALVEMLNSCFECYFIVKRPSKSIYQIINNITKNVIVLSESENYNSEAKYISESILKSNDIVVLDGYNFDTDYQKLIKTSGCILISIDDFQSFHYVADVVLNHASGLKQGDISGEKYTKKLLGTDYALLRNEFNEIARKIRVINKIENIFICFGGADSNNFTCKALSAVLNLENINKIYVIVGSAFSHTKELFKLSKTQKNKVLVNANLGAVEMINIMEKCQIAIAPASSILYELCCVKMGIISGYYVLNQKSIHKGLLDKNCIKSVYDFNLDFSVQLKAIIADLITYGVEDLIINQSKYFLGNSSIKIRKEFLDVFFSKNLKIRKSSIDDLMTYFHWTNDPETRKYSFSKQQIPLENHIKWFESKINSQSCFMYIFEIEAHPVGQIRYDIENSNAIISYSVAPEHRGRGLGYYFLVHGINQLKEHHREIEIVKGYVHFTNIASVKAFENANFQKVSDSTLIPYKESYMFFKKISTYEN